MSDSDSTNILPLFGESPFDQIKQTRPDGTEFWSARDLMPLLGYSAWRNFMVPVDRAMKSATVQGHDVETNFAGSRKVSSSGPDQADFELSRFAAYLVAMNGDPNKSEVAGAQAYFAVRTREAETATTPRELTFEEQTLAVLNGLTARVEQQRKELEKVRPLAALGATFHASTKSKNKQEFTRRVVAWAHDQLGIRIKFPDVYEYLGRTLGLYVVGERRDKGQGTTWAVVNNYIENVNGVSKTEHAFTQALITPRGQEYAWAKITAHIEENNGIVIKSKGNASA